MSGVAASGISNLYYQRETSLTLPLSAFQLWVNNERQGGCLACFLENYGYRFHRNNQLRKHTFGKFDDAMLNDRLLQRKHSVSATGRTISTLQKPEFAPQEMARRKYQNSLPIANFKITSKDSDSTDDAMITGQRATTRIRRSPTPPPSQLRSTTLSERSKSRNKHEENPVGNATIVQLLSSRKFGSVGGLYHGSRTSKKPKKIFTGFSKLWSKSHKKNALTDDDRKDAESNLLMSDVNSTERHLLSVNSKTSQNPRKDFPQVQSTAAPFGRTFSNEAFAARLWEEYEEVISSTKCNTNSLRRDKKVLEGNSLDRRSIKRRGSLFSTTQVPSDDVHSIIESISGLEELIHEPQSLKEFLSVRYLVWSFRKFLLTEFSEENLDFWLECEDYKKVSEKYFIKGASKIYEKYIKSDSLREINIPVQIRKGIEDKLDDPDLTLFEDAQSHVYSLMSSDSFKRFFKSDIYSDLVKTFPPSTGKRKRPAEAIRASLTKKLRR